MAYEQFHTIGCLLMLRISRSVVACEQSDFLPMLKTVDIVFKKVF